MKKINAKDIVRPAVALFVICLVASVLLALTNGVTADKIAQNLAETENNSRMVVMPCENFLRCYAKGKRYYRL